MQKGNATLDAAEHKACAQWCAELAGVARGGEMFRARLVLFICSSRREEAPTISDFGRRAPCHALTVSRTFASCGATCRLRQRFLDVSFQHSDWSLCNQDANSPWVRIWFSNDRKTPMKTGTFKIIRVAELIPVSARSRHLCRFRNSKPPKRRSGLC